MKWETLEAKLPILKLWNLGRIEIIHNRTTLAEQKRIQDGVVSPGNFKKAVTK